jgi:hypothetical protein
MVALGINDSISVIINTKLLLQYNLARNFQLLWDDAGLG